MQISYCWSDLCCGGLTIEKKESDGVGKGGNHLGNKSIRSTEDKRTKMVMEEDIWSLEEKKNADGKKEEKEKEGKFDKGKYIVFRGEEENFGGGKYLVCE